MGRNYVGVTVLTQRVGEGDETAVNDGGLGGLLQVTAVDLRNTLQRDRESIFLSPGLPTTNQIRNDEDRRHVSAKKSG